MDIEEEHRDGYLVSSKMKKVWNIELLLADKLLDVCKKHNLQIWADGGTMLGAVRHNGFIPWDDDIDFVMFREDYDKLLEIAKDEFQAPFFFQTAYSDKHYFIGHAKLRYDGTAAVSPLYRYSKMHQGINIDIFVLDELPNDSKIENAAYKKAERIRNCLAYNGYVSYSESGPIRKVKKFLSSVLVSLISSKRLFRRMDGIYRNMAKDHRSGYYAEPMLCVDDAKLFRRHKSLFEETIYMPFEDRIFPVAAGYDQLLTIQYGKDYMQPQHLPSYHGDLIFDTERSYKEVLKDLK